MANKSRLLVVAGAGASLDFGMPSVADVGKLLAQNGSEWFPLAEGKSDLYSWLSQQISTYWHKEAGRPSEPNFEDVLYGVFALASVFPMGHFTSPLAALAKPIEIPALHGLMKGRPAKDVLATFSQYCADKIVSDMRLRCRTLDTQTSNLEPLRKFLSALGEKFDVATVTLNYDDILWRCSRALTGFGADGCFNPRLIYERTSWPCMLHIHGSVHFDMQLERGDLHSIRWVDDLASAFAQNSDGRSPIVADEGVLFPQSVLIAGYGKTAQILRQPFRTYYSELDRLVSETDALLILGYGFGDEHVNLAMSRYRDDRRRPAVIIDFAKDNQPSAASADLDSSISRALHSLRTEPRSMNERGELYQTVAAVRSDFQFDRSTDGLTPLSIWYNGMREACGYSDRVISELSP